MSSAEPPVSTLPRRRLADDLRAAIEGGEVELRYQPQVAIGSGRIVGVEVLARWRHPRLGELGAERLFAAAARAGLSPALSQHIQQVALAAVADWRGALAQLGIAVNITASDLGRAGFAGMLLDRLDVLGIAPARLTVEITEHELIGDLAAAAEVLARLRQAGVAVALDDFGTGYSGIAYLKSLPIDYLKIDFRLAGDLMGTPREQVVVRHVIAMARELGLAVIAEGVESDAHRALLAEAGATHYQGYLCAPPLESAALTDLLERERCVS